MKNEKKKTSSDELKSEKEDEAKKTNTSSNSWFKPLLLLAALAALIGIGYTYRDAINGSFSGNTVSIPKEITKEQMELLVQDFPAAQRKALRENPEQKQQLVNNLKELLAIAGQAQKEGFVNDPLIQANLEEMELSTLAVNYDRKVNADKEAKPPLGHISDEEIDNYWKANDLENTQIVEKTVDSREAKFKTFIDGKLALARKTGQLPQDKEPTEAELTQAKDGFARTQIYYNEALKKLAAISSMPEEEKAEWTKFKDKAELQIALTQAQFVTQDYAQNKLREKMEVTEEEVKKYIEENPDLTNFDDKKKKAEEILEKVKSGEDFAKLAKEHSEDPGSKEKGGLYEDVKKEQFAPEFEVAALTMKPGEVTKELVKTNFGYHIIKLIKKNETKNEKGESQTTYDARHILFSTMIKDPENPAARGLPADQYVKSKLEKEKQESVLEEIKANNPVAISEDFDIPEVSEEDLAAEQKEQMERMKQMQNGPTPNAPKIQKEEPKENPSPPKSEDK